MFCMVAAIIVIISIIIIIIIISLVTIVVSLFQVLQKAPSFPTIPAPLPVFLISLTLPLLPFPALPSYGVEPKPGRCSRREGGGSCSSHGIRPHEGSKPLGNGGCLISHLPACLQTWAAQKKGNQSTAQSGSLVLRLSWPGLLRPERVTITRVPPRGRVVCRPCWPEVGPDLLKRVRESGKGQSRCEGLSSARSPHRPGDQKGQPHPVQGAAPGNWPFHPGPRNSPEGGTKGKMWSEVVQWLRLRALSLMEPGFPPCLWHLSWVTWIKSFNLSEPPFPYL